MVEVSEMKKGGSEGCFFRTDCLHVSHCYFPIKQNELGSTRAPAGYTTMLLVLLKCFRVSNRVESLLEQRVNCFPFSVKFRRFSASPLCFRDIVAA